MLSVSSRRELTIGAPIRDVCPGSGDDNESANACEKWVNWMNDSAAWLWYVSFESERRSYRRALSWMRLGMNWCMKSPRGYCKASAVCDQKLSKRSFPYGIILGVLRWQVVPSRPKRRRGWGEPSSVEVVCHAGSGSSPSGTMIR